MRENHASYGMYISYIHKHHKRYYNFSCFIFFCTRVLFIWLYWTLLYTQPRREKWLITSEDYYELVFVQFLSPLVVELIWRTWKALMSFFLLLVSLLHFIDLLRHWINFSPTFDTSGREKKIFQLSLLCLLFISELPIQ